ncbi:unnamed protein product [Owenia fusiformis]|uniref:Major facilitator superfamily (MFS) profile domain-containing protein n=1 Tax=Owenia fusiformis TaxID=6347 RepID=A0A8S4NQS8_OWEFU|nr:unnamed protein product [Owenia fusiformis]
MVGNVKLKQCSIFFLGWIAYGSLYLLRKPVGIVKSDLESDLHFSKSKLGCLDTAFLLPYAVIQIFLGQLGERFGAGKTFGICMCLSGVSMVMFGQVSNYYVMLTLLFLSGSSQSLCWPNATKVVGAWFSETVRNSMFGAYGMCGFAGGLAGTSIAVYLQVHYGWRSMFFTPSIIVIGLGILVTLVYRLPMEQANLCYLTEDPSATTATKQLTDHTPQQYSFITLLKISTVKEVAFGVLCLKVVRYTMFLWLPMYLLNQLNYPKEHAGLFSMAFEVGGLIGSPLIGIILDRYFQHNSLTGVSLSIFLSAISLIFYSVTSSWGMIFNTVFMLLAGAFNCGPDSILTGSHPNKLSAMVAGTGGAAIAGVVNGFGSLGTVVQGPIIGFVSELYGFQAMFYIMIGLSLTGAYTVYTASQQLQHLQNTAAKYHTTVL